MRARDGRAMRRRGVTTEVDPDFCQVTPRDITARGAVEADDDNMLSPARTTTHVSTSSSRAGRASRATRATRATNRNRGDDEFHAHGKDDDDDDARAPRRSRRVALTTAVTTACVSLGRDGDARATTEVMYEGTRRDAYAFDAPLRVTALRQSVTQSASAEFMKTQTKRVKFKMTTCASVAEVYSNLANDGKKTRGADCATLGDEWLAPAIANGLIQPVPNAESSMWYRSLPPVWRALVRRDPRTGEVSSSGLIYGAPYRFGCAMLAYRKDKLPKGVPPPRDWEDLFDPRLKGLIGMPNAPRLVLSAALKAEGLSANAADVGGVDGRVSARVRTLRENVKVFDDLQYSQAIACGDCAVVVGPSEDIFSVARRSTLIGLAVPRSGTTLWSDCWVVPTAASRNKGGVPSPLVEQWIDYTLSPGRINMRVGLKGGVSPLMFDGGGVQSGFARYPMVSRPVLGKDEGDMLKGWIPDDSVWAASEFQLPLSPRARAQYVAISRSAVA